MIDSLSGTAKALNSTAPTPVRSGGDGAFDRWKLHSEVVEPCRADPTSPDTLFVFGLSLYLMHIQSIVEVPVFQSTIQSRVPYYCRS